MRSRSYSKSALQVNVWHWDAVTTATNLAMFHPVIHRCSVFCNLLFHRHETVFDKVPADVDVGCIQPVVVDWDCIFLYCIMPPHYSRSQPTVSHSKNNHSIVQMNNTRLHILMHCWKQGAAINFTELHTALLYYFNCKLVDISGHIVFMLTYFMHASRCQQQQ